MSNRHPIDPAWITALLYLASLPLPAFHTTISWPGTGIVHEGSTWPGWEVLLLGWAGILDATIAWYSNPLLLASLVLYARRRSRAFHFSCAALLTALTSLFYRNMWNDTDPPHHIENFGVGFYLWLSSIGFLVWVTWSRQDEFENAELLLRRQQKL